LGSIWVLFSTGYDDSKRESIEEDSTPTRAGRRWDDSYCGRPACLRGGGQATSPDSRHRPQSARVQHRCPGRARQYRACRPGVFLEGDLARTSTGRPAVGSAATTPRSSGRPHNQAWKLWQQCSTARLISRALFDIPITQCERHQSDCSHYICSRGLCPARLRHGSRRRGAPLIDYGAVTMGSTGIPLVGRTRRVGGHLSVALL
jgi:hypothetical protein